MNRYKTVNKNPALNWYDRGYYYSQKKFLTSVRQCKFLCHCTDKPTETKDKVQKGNELASPSKGKRKNRAIGLQMSQNSVPQLI